MEFFLKNFYLVVEYFEWHKQERFRLVSSTEPDVWTKTPLLVMQCLKEEDSKCGGTADRTKPFLFLLREAYMTKRLMFIHWTLPARLEEFLVPPIGGMNWRAPKQLQDMVNYETKYSHETSVVSHIASENSWFKERRKASRFSKGKF